MPRLADAPALAKLSPGVARRRPAQRCTTPSPAAAAPQGRSCSGSSTTTVASRGRSTRSSSSRASAMALQAVGSAVRYETVAARPGPRDRHPRRRRALGLRLRVVRARGGGPPRRAHRRRAESRPRRPLGRARRSRARTGWSPRPSTPCWRPATSTTTGLRGRAVDGSASPALFELLTLVGYYATLALQLRVFRVGVPGADRAVGLITLGPRAMILRKRLSQNAREGPHEAGDLRRRPGRLPRRRRGRRARRAVDARVLRARRRASRETGARLPLGRRPPARADRAEEVLPHRRATSPSTTRSSQAVNWSHPVHKGIVFFQNVDAIIGPDDADRLSRGPDQGARLRARARPS